MEHYRPKRAEVHRRTLSHLDQMRKERPEIAKKIEQHGTATDTQSLLKGGHDKEKGK